MKQKIKGRPRKHTDAQVQRIRDWMPLRKLCRELGMTVSVAYQIRSGYQYKKPSP